MQWQQHRAFTGWLAAAAARHHAAPRHAAPCHAAADLIPPPARAVTASGRQGLVRPHLLPRCDLGRRAPAGQQEGAGVCIKGGRRGGSGAAGRVAGVLACCGAGEARAGGGAAVGLDAPLHPCRAPPMTRPWRPRPRPRWATWPSACPRAAWRCGATTGPRCGGGRCQCSWEATAGASRCPARQARCCADRCICAAAFAPQQLLPFLACGCRCGWPRRRRRRRPGRWPATPATTWRTTCTGAGTTRWRR